MYAISSGLRATIEIDDSPDGYIVAFQRCCRIASIVNVAGNSSNLEPPIHAKYQEPILCRP